jgi:hypothetical protein
MEEILNGTLCVAGFFDFLAEVQSFFLLIDIPHHFSVFFGQTMPCTM